MGTIGFWPILLAAAAYWVLGGLWFSVVAGNTWSNELTKLGITIKEPTRKQLITKFLTTFGLNLLACFILASLISNLNYHDWKSGAFTGFVVGLGFSATALGTTATWESRSFKLIAIDVLYPILALTIAGMILASMNSGPIAIGGNSGVHLQFA